jgi:DNA-binding MarR family transcriptional regulator
MTRPAEPAAAGGRDRRGRRRNAGIYDLNLNYFAGAGARIAGSAELEGPELAMGGPRWLSEEEQRAWHAFLAAGALLDRRLEQQLRRDAGLSHPQYEILVRLCDAPGGELRMTDLAGALYTSKSGATYQVTQLERAGLVRRVSSPADTRGVVAVVTGAGRRKLAQAAPGHVAAVRALLIDALTGEQLTVLADGLGEVARRLNAAP